MKASAVPFFAIYQAGWDALMASVQSAMPAAGPVSEAADAGAPIIGSNGLGIITIAGPLVKGDSLFLRLYGGTSYHGIERAVKAALADTKVDEILMHVDSPGGSVDGLDELATVIREARVQKPITAFIDGIGASAAYWLASQATDVVASPSALVGSIGVITVLEDSSKLFAKIGVDVKVVSTGPHKGTGVEGAKITPAQLAEVQRIIDFYGDSFREAIVQGRAMSPDAVKKLATGAVWPAPEALDNGLVNEVGTLQETLQTLARRVGEKHARGKRGRERRARLCHLDSREARALRGEA